jgi:hypothetical protein
MSRSVAPEIANTIDYFDFVTKSEQAGGRCFAPTNQTDELTMMQRRPARFGQLLGIDSLKSALRFIIQSQRKLSW